MVHIPGSGDHPVHPLAGPNESSVSEAPPAGNDAVSTLGQTAIFSDSMHGSAGVLRSGSPDLLGPSPGTVRPPVQVPADVAELWPQLPSALNILQNAVHESFQATSADNLVLQARSTEFKQLEAQFKQASLHGQLPDSAEQTMGALWNTMRQMPNSGFSDKLLEGAIRVIQNALKQAQVGTQILRDPSGAAAEKQVDAPEQQKASHHRADNFCGRVANRDINDIRDLFNRLEQSDVVQIEDDLMSDQMREQVLQQLQNQLKEIYELLSVMMKVFSEMQHIKNRR